MEVSFTMSGFIDAITTFFTAVTGYIVQVSDFLLSEPIIYFTSFFLLYVIIGLIRCLIYIIR